MSFFVSKFVLGLKKKTFNLAKRLCKVRDLATHERQRNMRQQHGSNEQRHGTALRFAFYWRHLLFECVAVSWFDFLNSQHVLVLGGLPSKRDDAANATDDVPGLEYEGVDRLCAQRPRPTITWTHGDLSQRDESYVTELPSLVSPLQTTSVLLVLKSQSQSQGILALAFSWLIRI